METELRETNRLLTAKLDKLIHFLNVCPLCINGQLQDHKKPRSSSMMGQALASATDTWSLTIEMYCSNQSCDYETLVDNPDYKHPTIIRQKTNSIKDTAPVDEFADLFG